MPDYTWTIDTGRSDGGVVVNSLSSAGQGQGLPTITELTRGEDVTLSAGFWADSALADHVARYKDLRIYGDFAGNVAVNMSIGGQPLVVERLDASAPVDSLIVDFVPGADVDHQRGFWGAIQAVTDGTSIASDAAALDLTVTILAEDTEYTDRAALKSDIGGGLP